MTADFMNHDPQSYSDDMTISRELVALMAAKNMNQEEIGRAAGVSQSTVSRWLKGSTKPRKKHLAAIHAMANAKANEDNPKEKLKTADEISKLIGDKPITPETGKLLIDFFDKFLSGFHPAAGQLWREAVQSTNPFPADIPFSEEHRDRLLTEAELQGRRAQLRTKR